MAEAFGIAAGTITIGGLTRRLVTSVSSLKRLWNEVKGAPETVKDLIENLELVNAVLSVTEMEFSRLDSPALNERIRKLSMDHCHRAVRELELLVEEMHGKLKSARKLKRNFAKLKVPIKKQSIRSYQEKLQHALQILLVSQQNHLMLLAGHSYLPKQNQERLTKPCVNHDFTSEIPFANTLPWRRTFAVGNFTSQMLEGVTHSSSNTICSSAQVYHARLKLPTYFVRKVWDFLVCRPSDGWWKISLCTWNVRPDDSVIFDYALDGSSSDILSAISSGQASLHDRDSEGRTLLHFAAYQGHLETFKCLIRHGLKATERDGFGCTPLAYLYRAVKDCNSAVDLVRFLLNEGGLDDVIYSVFDPGYLKRRETSLHRLIWAVPGLLPVIIGDLHADFIHMAPKSKFASLAWEYVDPELLLSVLRHGGATRASDFRAFLHSSVESSVHSFAKVYFSRSPHISRDNSKSDYDVDSKRQFRHWRSLARWIFSGISKEEMSKQGGAPWESLTPFFAGLTGSRWSVPKSARERRLTMLRMIQTTHMWLEDVRLSGLDLLEYGQHESNWYALYTRNHTWRWKFLSLGKEALPPSGPQLVSLSYGTQPEQWQFEWDLAVEEFAGDFWKMVDNPPLRVPGGWIDDQ